MRSSPAVAPASPSSKPGMKESRAQHQRVVLGRAALEGLAVHRALEVDHHLVAVLWPGPPWARRSAPAWRARRAPRPRPRPRRAPPGAPARSRRSRSRAPRAAPRRSSRPRRPGHSFQSLLATSTWGWPAGLSPVSSKWRDMAPSMLSCIASPRSRGPNWRLRSASGTLALPEPLHLDGRPRLLQLGLHLGVELGGRDRDGVGLAEPLVERLDHLHDVPPPVLTACLVRMEGLEPPRLAAAGPKPAASTGSATSASGATPGMRRLSIGGAGDPERRGRGVGGRPRADPALRGLRGGTPGLDPRANA